VTLNLIFLALFVASITFAVRTTSCVPQLFACANHKGVKKMTGGTPEVRSVKINLIDFWHLTFDLIDFLHFTFGLVDFLHLKFDLID